LWFEDSVELETVAVRYQAQARGIGIWGFIFREENVEVIKLRPIEPESWRAWRGVFGSDNELCC
jgi:hypothetical protein